MESMNQIVNSPIEKQKQQTADIHLLLFSLKALETEYLGKTLPELEAIRNGYKGKPQ